MALEQARSAFRAFDVADGSGQACPAAGVFCKLRIRGLEKDLDAVERCNDCFCLFSNSTINTQFFNRYASLLYLPHNPLDLQPDHCEIHSPDSVS